MEKDIQVLNDYLADVLDASIENIQQDLECEAYFGFNFKLKNWNVKFRKAKITPKKIGQFVTLWRRNSQGETEAFNVNDDFQFYIIMTEDTHQLGFFIFPNSVLEKQNILSNAVKDGKRGFRVYSVWDSPDNKQALKTQSWQQQFFIDMKNFNPNETQKLKDIFLKYSH